MKHSLIFPFNEALTFSLKSCKAVISYFISSEVARKLLCFYKMARRSKVARGSCSGVNIVNNRVVN